MDRRRHLIVTVGASLAAVAVLASATAAGASQARPAALTRGTAGGTPWEVTAAPTTVSKLPGLCFAFMFGSGYGDGGTNCVAPVRGHSAKGPPWTFDPGAMYNGLSPATITRTGGGLRSIMFLAVRSARRVVVHLRDGEVLRLKTIPIPSRFHRPASLAVSVRHIGSSLPPMVRVKSGVAYNAKGKVVGRFSRKAPPLVDFTYG